jgi:pimeloyl-ACP methyl ester carboxylesterase
MSCLYRPSLQFVTQFDGMTYADVLNAGSDYKKTFANAWAYYNPAAPLEPDPYPWYPEYKFKRVGRLMARWYEKARSPRAAEAVIAIHGSSSIPDMWFADSQAAQGWPMDYLNHGGTALYNSGYDVFAPHVTHVPRFNLAGARLAEANGERPHTLDLSRCLALFDELKARGYERIHIVGISYGGQLAGHLARALRDDVARGVVLAIEGWLPETAYIRVPNAAALFLGNWENMFGNGQSDAVFRDLPDRTYVAYGSCSLTADPGYPGLTDLYSAPYATLPAGKVIYYTGAHEYLHSVFAEAMARAYP